MTRARQEVSIATEGVLRSGHRFAPRPKSPARCRRISRGRDGVGELELGAKSAAASRTCSTTRAAKSAAASSPFSYALDDPGREVGSGVLGLSYALDDPGLNAWLPIVAVVFYVVDQMADGPRNGDRPRERSRPRDERDRDRPRDRDDRRGYDRRERDRDDRRRDDRGYERRRSRSRDRGRDRRGERPRDDRDRGRDERRRDERRRSRSRDRHRRRDRDDDRGRPARREEKPPKPEKRDDSSKSRSLSWSPPPAVRRQMAEAKARKKREAAAIAAGEIQPAQKSGKFWDGFRWVEHTPASQMPSNPATRKERRLYVGNLPQTFDSEQLRIFLNEALRACGAIPAGVDEVVVSSWVSPDKKFAFVELSTVEAATTSLGLSGITCMGCQLKICHPNNYVVGALPGTGPTLPAQYAAAGMLGQVGMPPGAGGAEGGVAAQPGASYAPGYGPDAAAGNEEFINAALAAMASGNPPG